jgi:hypothetical protein
MKYSKMLFAIFTIFLLISEINLINAQSHNVAYIYETDSSNGLSFRSFLNASYYPTSLIKIFDIYTTNFDDFGLIIIDSRSGDFGNWGTLQEVQIIQNLNKPILALGTGGSSFYEQLGLSIRWVNSWTNPDTLCNFQSCTKIFAEDTLLSVFNTPYKINFPQPPSSPIIQLYNNSSYIGLYKPILSDSVLYVGREPIDTAHYSIVAEGELYWLWGFDNSPASMTQTGKELFINIIYHLIGGTVGVDDEQSLSVFSFKLNQNYPNPFNPSTIISWQSPVGSWQTLKIYDVLGNEITTLVDEFKPAGTYEVEWNATGLPSGVYFYQLKTNGFVETKKMLLMK